MDSLVSYSNPPGSSLAAPLSVLGRGRSLFEQVARHSLNLKLDLTRFTRAAQAWTEAQCKQGLAPWPAAASCRPHPHRLSHLRRTRCVCVGVSGQACQGRRSCQRSSSAGFKPPHTCRCSCSCALCACRRAPLVAALVSSCCAGPDPLPQHSDSRRPRLRHQLQQRWGLSSNSRLAWPQLVTHQCQNHAAPDPPF